MIFFFLVGVILGLAVLSFLFQVYRPSDGKIRAKSSKSCPSPPSRETIARWEREAFAPISDLVEKAEAKAEREFYGASVMPSSVYRIPAEEHLPGEEGANARRRLPQIIPLDPKANTGRRGDKRKCRSDGQYDKYIPGIGLIRAETPEKLERLERAVREELDWQVGDYNRLLRKFDELQSWLAMISRLDDGTSEKIAEKKTRIQKELRQIRQEIKENSNTYLTLVAPGSNHRW